MDEKPPNGGWRRAFRWFLVVLLSATVVLSSFTTVDRYAEAEYEELFQRALITFALARTLNGVISAVQGTELALQPAGVGVTLTPGEVLDPVNDLVERFSWIMFGATLSLGVQQVLLDIGQWWGLRLLLAGLGLTWLWVHLARSITRQAGAGDFERILLRTLLVVLFLRFAVPLAMIANEGIYRLFLDARYQESTRVIETAGEEISKAGQPQPTESVPEEGEGGFFESLGRSFDSTRESLDLSRRVAVISERASGVIEHLIQLSVVFVLQTGILPIAFLWLLLQLFRQLFRRWPSQ